MEYYSLVRYVQHSHPGAQPGGAFGAFAPPENIRNIV